MSEPKEATQRAEDAMFCVSAYRLDRHFLGAETPVQQAQTAEHVKGCAHCQRELGQLRRYAAQAEVFFEQEQQGFRLDGFLGWGRWAAVFCMILLSVVGWRWIERWRQEKQHSGYAVLRGETPQFRVIRKRGSLIEQVRSGDGFASGDLLRLVVRWRRGGFVYIVHRAANGELTPLYPSRKDAQSLRLESDKEVEFPGSLEVEGAPKGKEEIGVCFSQRPRRLQDVSLALDRARREQREIVHMEGQEALCVSVRRFVLLRIEKPQ